MNIGKLLVSSILIAFPISACNEHLDSPVKGSTKNNDPAASSAGDSSKTSGDRQGPASKPSPQTEKDYNDTADENATPQGISDSVSKALLYMDYRTKAWYSKKDWGFVEGGQCAISCHTTIPFMIGNPFVTEESIDVATEMRSILVKRINSWATIKPLYTWDAVDSKGTESVLNSIALMLYDLKISKKVSRETCSAVSNMWESMSSAGKFPWLSQNLSPWEDADANYWASSLVSIVLSDMSKSFALESLPESCGSLKNMDSKLAVLRAGLKRNVNTTSLHGQTWLLWADSESDSQILNAEQRLIIVDKILNKQQSDGGFSAREFLAPGSGSRGTWVYGSDPYMTSIVVMSLRSTKKNVGFDPAILEKAEAWLAQYEESDITAGKFNSLNKPTNSWNNSLFKDAAISYWVLAKTKK
jgi:hypothetical protein